MLISNLGNDSSELHPLKALASWRCKCWWTEQQMYNDLDWDPIRHFARQSRPKRWEDQFSTNWMHTLFKAS